MSETLCCNKAGASLGRYWRSLGPVASWYTEICPEVELLGVFFGASSKSMKNLTILHFFHLLMFMSLTFENYSVVICPSNFLWKSCKESRFMIPLAMHHLNCEGKN